MPTAIDLHVHTTYGSSDSNLTPLEMAAEAKRLRLSGLCVTEHNYLWDPHKFASFAREHDMLLIRGVEVDTDMGHVLVFGIDAFLPGIGEIGELRRVVKQADAFMITAHPFRGLHSPAGIVKPYLYRGGAALPQSADEASEHAVFSHVDAVEVANGNTVDSENRFAADVATKLGMRATGGSDAHSVHGLGRCVTVFHDEIRTEAEFIEALRRGRYYPAAGLRTGQLHPFGVAAVQEIKS